MKMITLKFAVWLMSLTRVMRYLVVAVMCHVLLLLLLGSISIAVQNQQTGVSISFPFPGPVEPPAPPPRESSVPAGAANPVSSLNRHGESSPAFPATRIAAKPTLPTIDHEVQKVFSVFSEDAHEFTRIEGSGSGTVMPPSAGIGDHRVGVSVFRGTGGNFDHRRQSIRTENIVRQGGNPESERAVLGALRWLKENQRPDGSWPGHEALAALATLCFLGRGETPDSDEFGPTVAKALGYLVSIVDAQGIVKSRNMYSQGAVTLALAEAFGMTQSPQIREPLERAVLALLLSQKTKKTTSLHEGGWRYTPTSVDADTSVSGWLIMALKSAKLAGIAVPEEAFAMASNYLWNMYAPTGGFGYATLGRGQATTAIGILCQQFLGYGSDRRIQKALDFYTDHKVDWEQPTTKGHTLYAWYYATQALFQGGDKYWERWNTQMRETLVKNQQPDGHWDFPAGSNEKSHGLVYSTTLCCLILEVYYRYLPIYQEMEKKHFPVKAKADW